MFEDMNSESLAAHAVELSATINALQQTLRQVKNVLQRRLTKSGECGEPRRVQVKNGAVSLVLRKRRGVRPDAIRAMYDAGELSIDQLFAIATFTVGKTSKTLGERTDAVTMERRETCMKLVPTHESTLRAIDRACSLFDEDLATVLRASSAVLMHAHGAADPSASLVANTDDERLRQAG